MKSCGFSISGKNNSCGNNISGKHNYYSKEPQDITHLKKNIINKIILPIISKKWKKIEENMFSFEKMNRQIDMYSKYYNKDDLLIYKDILKALELFVIEHKQLDELEKTMYGSENDISTMIYKTTMIRLKPEYEIYDAIFGKPKKNKNHEYDLNKIQEIQECLQIEDVDFDQIKEIITATNKI